MSQKGLTSAAKGELVFTSFLFLAGVIILADTFVLAEPTVEAFVSPKVVAYAVGIALTALPLFQIFQIFKGNLGKPEGIEGGEISKEANWVALGVAIGALAFYAIFVQILGFIISASVLFAGIALALGATNKLRVAIIAVVLSTVLYFSFTMGLQLPLPVGFDFIPGLESEEQVW
jgi:putative tricarboxylic transport membrane protein